jgi:MFS family permease
VLVLTQVVMIAIMTMTPVHMLAHGHTAQAAGLVISLHVGAMFLPSPVTGLLVDRIGGRWVARASGPLLLAAGALAALAPAGSVPTLGAALVLLGLGWNFGLISGTSIVTGALPPDRRATAQGLVDVGLAAAAAAGSLVSGLVVAREGYPALALMGGLAGLLILPVSRGRAFHLRGGSSLRRAVRNALWVNGYSLPTRVRPCRSRSPSGARPEAIAHQRKVPRR